MNDNVDAIIDGPEENGRGNGIVANYGDAIFAGNVGYFFVLQNIIFGIADAFYINQAGIVLDCSGKILRLFGVNESNINAQLSESLIKKRNSPAVEGARRYDVASRAANVKDADIDCRLS
ncbi:hypothetical protein ES703_117734 [subsurface metagenome]